MMRTFLIIEDDLNMRETLRYLFSKAFPGAKVSVCATNVEAFELIERLPPELVTTDITRPAGSGLDFLREFRRRFRGYPIPVVAITGTVERDSQFELELYRAGFNAVIIQEGKPLVLPVRLEKV